MTHVALKNAVTKSAAKRLCFCHSHGTCAHCTISKYSAAMQEPPVTSSPPATITTTTTAATTSDPYNIDHWYPQLRTHTFPSSFIPLSKEEVEALIHQYEATYKHEAYKYTDSDKQWLQDLEGAHHTRTCTPPHAHTYAHTRTSTRTRTHAHKHTRTQAHTHTDMHTHAH